MMDRRELLGISLAAVAAAASTGVQAAEVPAHAHHAATAGAQAIFQAANECVAAAQLCQAHCQQLLASGERSLADCSKSVSALIPVCQALAALAAQDSPFLPHYARVAGELCGACEQQCRKHEKEHAACRECAEACAHCAKQCEAVAA